MSRAARRTSIALTVAAVAAVATAAAASGDGAREVISFTTKQAHQTLLDHGEPGFGVDDIVVFSNDLYQHGRKIGEDGGTCTVIRVAPDGEATMYCAGNNSLPDGQISVAGFAAPGAPFELAITGGTGRYRTAHGQVVGRNTSPTEMEISLFLR
jgi:hypothetical protein